MYSIELTPTNIHIVSGIAGRNYININSTFSAPMPPGAYFNGYIKDYASVAKAIRDMLLSRNIRRGAVDFVLDSTAVKTKMVAVPDENRQNVLSILNKEMADILASEPHVLDYMVYEKYKEHGKWYSNCMLYAVPKEIIAEFSKLSAECGLQIREVDFQHNVISKLWELEEPGIKRSTPQEMKRRIQKKSAKKSKKSENKNIDPEWEEDEQVWQPSEEIHIKQKLHLWIGLYQDSIRLATNAIDGNCYCKTIAYSEGMQDSLISETGARKEQILFFLDQVQMFLQFISSSNARQQLEIIRIYGDYEDMDEIVQVLQKQVAYPVELLKYSKRVKGISEADYPAYCTAVGAIFRR